MEQHGGAGAGIYTDGQYLEHNPTWHVDDSAWKAGNITRMLERNQVAPRTVAEIGCGAGEILKQLHDRLPDTVRYDGFDISPQAIVLARGRAGGRIRFHEEDMLKRVGEPFDVVLCIDVFEHVDDYLGFLRELRKTGRTFVFHIPLNLSVQTLLRVGPIMRGRAQLGHIHYFTKETALATLADTGYRVRDHLYTAGSLELRSQTLLNRLTRLPRRLAFGVHPDLAVRVLGGFSLMVLADAAGE
jgi:2-polyprenyl-3-methyl-5-hydroxy-6-metoxy-1,4-benzoquinol methylase